MNVYEIITDKILAEIDKGIIPWHKPWKAELGGEQANLISKKSYRGINRFILNCAPYDRPYWLTYNQAAALGGTVRKGEKGTPIIFWKQGSYVKAGEEESGERTTSFVLRYYTVFNVAQCDGLTAHLPALPATTEAVIASKRTEAERIALGFANGPRVAHVRGDRAYYTPAQDAVTMPERTQFANQDEYYSTLFHELTHSTGHENRLNRQTLVDASYFGSCNYSKEELVAEMGAAFLCGAAGIENAAVLKNSASYLKGWSAKLKGDSRVIVLAAGQAQRAADHILGVQWADA